MLWSFLYIAVRRVFELAVLVARSERSKELADTLRAVSEPAVTEAERRAQTER